MANSWAKKTQNNWAKREYVHGRLVFLSSISSLTHQDRFCGETMRCANSLSGPWKTCIGTCWPSTKQRLAAVIASTQSPPASLFSSFSLRNSRLIHRVLATVKIKEYTTSMGLPKVMNKIIKLPGVSLASYGNCAANAKYGKSQEEKLDVNNVQSNGSQEPLGPQS